MEMSHMTDAAWLELEQIVSRFEEALHDQQSPRIRDYLSTREVDPVSLLIELIAAEAEHRWRQGQSATASEYTSTFADLLSDGRDRDRLEATLDDVRRTNPPGCLEPQTTATRQKQRPPASDSSHLGRYQMIEPISRTSRAP